MREDHNPQNVMTREGQDLSYAVDYSLRYIDSNVIETTFHKNFIVEGFLEIFLRRFSETRRFSERSVSKCKRVRELSGTPSILLCKSEVVRIGAGDDGRRQAAGCCIGVLGGSRFLDLLELCSDLAERNCHPIQNRRPQTFPFLRLRQCNCLPPHRRWSKKW